MKDLLVGCLIIFGVIFVYGFIRGEERGRLTIKTIVEPRLVTIAIGLPDADETYRYLSVYGCSAAMTESGTYCTGDWERESTQETDGHHQYLFFWRNLPPGTMRITAMAFDVNAKILAQHQQTIFRGE